jgi:hypothetical protein
MIPTCFPKNSSNQWVVYEVSPGVEWKDHIPIQVVTEVAASEDRHNDDGHIDVDTLADITGLTAWVDYTPIDIVTGRSGRWLTSADGFIPVVDKTP